MAFTRDELLATVELSPQAAGAHDRQGWVGLFAAGGQVEDPVGSRPHRGAVQIERFYDTFIAPRDITFHRDADIVAGSTVIRDLELEVVMSPSVTMRIPAYLRYAVESAPAGPRIGQLQAYWELPSMIGQFARAGLGAVPVGLRLTGALLRNQGPSGALGFAKGLDGVGRPGRRLVAGLLDDLCAGDAVAVQRRLGTGTVICAGDDAPMNASGLLERTAGATWRKPIVSGSSVAAGLEDAGRRAVVIADLARRPLRVTRFRYYTDAM
ncbi:ketosteroid isomerase family protein [Mycolicibacterium houstonense]|uniref:ketosteroid isomerase family protein n=1 Tax=Mycolicibacterium houstonense TaxID=146021 RepID=UPI000835B860|nr:ketosteroid isomerase family protein [Mycolicibacterium houstonense]